MRHISIFVVALLLAAQSASGQTLTTYTASSAQGEWQSIAGTGTLLASVTGDYGTQTLALPFDFMFGQSDYPQGTTITVRADGFVVMRGSGGNHNALNYWNQPSYSIISPFPLKDGQLVGAESGCWWQLATGDDGDPMLVIEWRGLHRYPYYPVTQAETDLDNFNYQLRLHANGDISAVYGHMQSGVPSDSLFNFILTDGATMIGAYMDQNSLRGTWDSVVACSACTPGYRQGNNWVMFAANNLAGCPDSGTVVTWHRPQPPCPRPTAIAVTAVAHDTALLSWTPNEVVGSVVRIQWDTVNFTPGGAGHHLQLYGGDTMHLSGLTPNHQHWLYMRSDCGEDSSEWHGVQFTTPCAPLSHDVLPLTEDFESYAEGYTTLWGGCSGNTVYVKDMQAYEGRPNMALRGNSSGWFHLPPVDSVRTTVLHLSGHGPFGGISTPQATVQVGVMDDPFDINSLQVLQTFTVNQNAWQEYTVPMATYTGTGNTVAVKWSAYNMFFLDDLTLEVYEGCLPVEAVTVGEVGQHTARVSWSAFVPTGSYRVEWYPQGNEGLAQTLTTTSDSVTLTGLTANTVYVVDVYALCDSSESEAASTLVHTRCAVPLPIYEDFEGMLQLPDCWGATSMTTSHSSGSYTPAVPEVMDADGNHVVRFSSQFTNSNSYERGILLLPFVDTTVNRLRLSFDYRVARFPYLMTMMVGVIPGDDDIEHFVPLDTVAPYYDTLWHTYTVETGALPMEEGRLVLMQHSTQSHEYVPGYWRDLGYVDNIHIELLPSCDRPAVVHVDQITSTTARIHWQENNGVDIYRVTCDGSDYVVNYDTVVTVNGLQPGTDYWVGVSRRCTGEWTPYRTAFFRTSCAPVVDLPYTEDFETWVDGEVDYCWRRFQNTQEGSSVGAEASAFVESAVGARKLRLRAVNYAVDPQPYDAVAVLPEVGLPFDGLAIGFDVNAFTGQPANMVLELGVMDYWGDSSSFSPLDTVPVGTTWSYYEHAFDVADSGRLALRLKSLNGLQSVYVDNLGIMAATGCARPQAVTVDTVTQHTATVTVVDTAAAGHYRLYWRASNALGTDSADVDSATATLTGLEQGRHYTVYAAARCGSSLSYVVGVEFDTDCDTLVHDDLPYTENFNMGVLNHCWSVLPAGSYNVDVDTSHYGLSGYSMSLGAYSYNAQAYAVMPVLDTLAGVDLTFRLKKSSFSSDASVTVGVMGNPNDSTTFVPVETFAATGVWTEHQVSLGAYSTSGHYVAFRPDRSDTSWSVATMYVDEVVLGQSLPCSRPDSIRVDSVGATTAVLTVSDAGRAGRYRVLLTSAAGTTSHVYDLDSTLDENSVLLTGLTSATDYEVSVASVCYDGSVTFSVSSGFTTACAPKPLPYREGFESSALYAMPYCWNAGAGSVRVSGAGRNSARCLYAYLSSSDSQDYVDIVGPELACGPDSLAVTFYVTASQGYSDSNYNYHPFDTRLQVFAILDDSLTLVYDDTVAYGSDWHRVDIALAPLAYGTRLLFRPLRAVVGMGSMSVRLDDLVVKKLVLQQHCDMVTEVHATEVGYTDATVEWTAQGEEPQWEVHLRGEGTNTTFVTDSTRVHFSNLAHNTMFAFMVRPLCDDTLTGPWSDTLWFSTMGCRPVYGVEVEAAEDSAVVRWRLADAQSAWDISYGPENFPTGGGVTIHVDAAEQAQDSGATVSYTLTGLEPGETYDVYVRAVCGEQLRSVWSQVTRFTTAHTGIDAGEEGAAIVVSPNPTTGMVAVSGLAPDTKVRIVDQNGRETASLRMTAADSQQPTVIDMTEYAPGVYYLLITTVKGVRVMKVVKM